MKLTLKIKLLPTDEQANFLISTIKEANNACDAISEIAWDRKAFNQFKLHKEAYYTIKSKFNLSSQVIIRCISKVTDSYKIDRKTKRQFRPCGSIAYDSRILSYKPSNIVSIWCIDGRLKIPFICHNTNYLPYIKGEADLVFKKGKFYLFQTVEIPDEEIKDVEEFFILNAFSENCQKAEAERNPAFKNFSEKFICFLYERIFLSIRHIFFFQQKVSCCY